MSYIIGNGTIYDGKNFYPEGSILINGNKIEKIGPSTRIAKEGLEFIDVQGRIIVPGFLNPHFHFYSSLSPGIAPLKKPNSFLEILKYFWWPLDRSLEEESIYYSALLGAMASVKHGVTMIFDHHASMNYIRGSLNIIKQACQQIGIKALLCYETSNRLENLNLDNQIQENINFYQKNKDSSSYRGIFGLHANFTLSASNMEEIKSSLPPDMPIHIHCGEDRDDLNYCLKQGFKGLVDRLNYYNFLSTRSILAHCVHLSDYDIQLIKEIKPVVISNPQSNFNNKVGKFNSALINDYRLGTDAMTTDMISTHRFHYLTDPMVDLEKINHLLFGFRRSLQQMFFPKTGLFENGYRADITVLDYIPCQEVTIENIISHLIFGVKAGISYMTISDGKIIYAENNFTNIDELEIYRQAIKVGVNLKKRFLKCQI